MNAALVTSVNRHCEPVGAEDFESFSLAFVVGAGLEVGTVATFDIEAGDLSADLDFPTSYELPFLTYHFPLYPSNGTDSNGCFVLVSDTPAVAAANGEIEAANITSLVGVPATSGTLFHAESAIPTWNFTKIESYYSANGHLPTNVNYDQMAAATSIPPQIYQVLHPPAPSNSSTTTGQPPATPTSTQTSTNHGIATFPGSSRWSRALMLLIVAVFV